MRCPNCGAEMKEGLLYCENCGEEIHIVPDFEPELEQNIRQNLDRIVQNVAHPDGAAGDETASDKQKKQTKELSGRVGVLSTWIALIVFCAVLFFAGIKIFQYYSPEYQIRRARQCTDEGQYERAVSYYTRAMELDRDDVELKLEIANIYFVQNDKNNYEYWLRQVVSDPYAEKEQLESTYGKLIAIYRAKEDYQAINDMLLECTDESIRNAYKSYLAEKPVFSVAGGGYNEVQALKLIAEGNGVIYYTMDGQIPDETKERYTAPILLENGDYVVRAVFVNENGVCSEVAEEEYHILAPELGPPELSVDSGEYDHPMFIRVLNDDGNIYYTVDGTRPTLESSRYTEPIPMPVGDSYFCFARIENGRYSEVIDRFFTFHFTADVTSEQAALSVRDKMFETQKIYDNAGHFDDTGAYYMYQYLYVAEAENENIVYVIAEVMADPEGTISRTGNYYAVNAYTGEVSGLKIENGYYQLTEWQ